MIRIEVLAELNMRYILNMGRKTKRLAVFYGLFTYRRCGTCRTGEMLSALDGGRGGFL
jgi:hypothetical protein